MSWRPRSKWKPTHNPWTIAPMAIGILGLVRMRRGLPKAAQLADSSRVRYFQALRCDQQHDKGSRTTSHRDPGYRAIGIGEHERTLSARQHGDRDGKTARLTTAPHRKRYDAIEIQYGQSVLRGAVRPSLQAAACCEGVRSKVR